MGGQVSGQQAAHVRTRVSGILIGPKYHQPHSPVIYRPGFLVQTPPRPIRASDGVAPTPTGWMAADNIVGVSVGATDDWQLP